MAQYSVHANPNPGTRADIPFLLDVQADGLSVLATRVVVPLYRATAAKGGFIPKLTPALEFQGQKRVAMVPELAGIPRSGLGPELGGLGRARNAVLAALDLVLTGF